MHPQDRIRVIVKHLTELMEDPRYRFSGARTALLSLEREWGWIEDAPVRAGAFEQDGDGEYREIGGGRYNGTK
jgi:hypothetical protein